VSITEVGNLERYLNTRLLRCDTNIHLNYEDLRFSHLDDAPRNIIITSAGVPCLVHWASAGYCPSFMELRSVRINTAGDASDKRSSNLLEAELVSEMSAAGDREPLIQANATMAVLGNSIRYSL